MTTFQLINVGHFDNIKEQKILKLYDKYSKFIAGYSEVFIGPLRIKYKIQLLNKKEKPTVVSEQKI